MKTFAITLALAAGIATGAHAALGPIPQPITGLYNTGVDSSHAVVPAGTVGDAHYTLGTRPGGTSDLRAIDQNSFPGNVYASNGVGDNTTSRWIGPNNDASVDGPTGPGNTNYTFTTHFDLTGFDLRTVEISGLWSTDNQGVDILLNGVSSGYASSGFGGYDEFGFSDGFVQGDNTLTFVVFNEYQTSGYNPIALRVDSLEGSGLLAPTPEPASWATLGLGALALLGLARRAKKSA